MKKLFVYALAVGMFTACSQDETIEMQSPMQISFEGAYVGNATRAIDPSFNNTDKLLEAFDVWGFMEKATGMVFVDEDVKKGDNDNWTYDNKQYWTPNRTYYFAALAPMESRNVTEVIAGGEDAKYGLGTITFTNNEGDEDLLYAATTVTTGSSITKQPDPVKFEFSHLLSKVKFSFTNAFNNSNAYIKVTNIKMNVPKTAKINLAQADWWSTNQWCDYTNSTTLDFGNMENQKVSINKSTECQFERLTFPTTDRSYTVTFNVELYYGDVLAYSSSLSTKIENVVLEMGKAYNFHAEINHKNIVPGDGEDDELYPIEFTATVKDWDDGNGYNGGPIVTE